MKCIARTDEPPEAVGAYSQATTDGSLVFTASQLPLTPEGDLLDGEDVATRTERALTGLLSVLAAEDAGAEDIPQTTIYLAGIDRFDAMNEAYAEVSDDAPPARSAVEVGALPKGVAVETEAVASIA